MRTHNSRKDIDCRLTSVLAIGMVLTLGVFVSETLGTGCTGPCQHMVWDGPDTWHCEGCYTYCEIACVNNECKQCGGDEDKYCCNSTHCCDYNKSCCGSGCTDPATQGCCNNSPYNLATQGCCGDTIYDLATEQCCDDISPDIWPNYPCGKDKKCCKGNCIDDTKQCCRDAATGYPCNVNESCCNGECKPPCTLSNGGVCASMNSDCGCSSPQTPSCGDHLKTWSAGVDKICNNGGCGCNTCSEMILCYWFLLCKGGPSEGPFRACGGDGYCVMSPNPLASCVSCVPRYDIPAQPQYRCQQACE